MANWEGVTEFVAVGETSSFTAAAKKLNTSTAQISRRVAALEERLSVKLLNRTTRKVTLTEAGLTYFQQCRHLLEGLEQAELEVTQMQSAPKGQLKVTAPASYGERYLAPLINEFIQLYPQLALDLVLTNRKLDIIEHGIDIAIRLGRLEDSSFIAKRLSSRRLIVCASKGYLANHGIPHSLSELQHHQCLVGSVEQWRFRVNDKEKSVRVHGRIKCNSGYALLDAAKRGLGLVQLPEYYVKDALQQGCIVEVLNHYQDKREGIWAMYPENRNLSPKVSLLIEFLAERLPDITK